MNKNCIELPEGTDEQPLNEGDQLVGLSDGELNHLSLGLLHAHGAVLTRPIDAGGLLFLAGEDGTLIAIRTDCTVSDVWQLARFTSFTDSPAHSRTGSRPPDHSPHYPKGRWS